MDQLGRMKVVNGPQDALQDDDGFLLGEGRLPLLQKSGKVISSIVHNDDSFHLVRGWTINVHISHFNSELVIFAQSQPLQNPDLAEGRLQT